MENKRIKEMIITRLHTPVAVKLLKDLTEEISKELEIPVKSTGSEFEIPWWKAKILMDEKIAELLDENEIDETYIQKKVWSEKAKTQPEELEKTFYLKLSNKLGKLKNEFKMNPSPILMKKIENLETLLNDLLSARLSKILKMSFRGAPPKILENLTLEEKWLYDEINQIIKIWVERILGD
ncbi:MAG: DNA replication complex GINS family protein [Candidatus Odinarchaeum yellowstonii]|uniref:DNA replication complex GINS family protein n=1 Tax=Odinarchaeota yellowstonii (strain LCB_4) TaxID=1841599 RepID=A0AAF0D2Z9_ODILC|nr:MAG: DNA replication complex GINS family protein [Candidatus Odinarchaeum yellowstonii]